MEDVKLEELRYQLDEIDHTLLSIVKKRIDCCIEIGHYKRENNVAMMQPHRIEHVKQRAAEFGERNNVNSLFLINMYDLIIKETCRVEDIVIGKS